MTKRRARAIASGFVLVIASAFIVASMWQIIVAALGQHPVALAKTPDEAACSAALTKLVSALDRASTNTARVPDAFDRALAPEWNDAPRAQETCEKTERGRDAWVSLLRLKYGLEGRAQKDLRDIEPLRRDFDARLP